MYDKLILLLRQLVSEPCSEALIQSLLVLDAYQYTGPWSDIASYIDSGPRDSTAMLIDTIESIITLGLKNVLGQLTIQVDGNHVMMTTVLEGLKLLEGYDDSESILVTIDQNLSTIETLSELLELVTPCKADDFMLSIIDCSPSLVSSIRAVYDGTTVTEDDNPLRIPEDKLPLVRRFIIGKPNSIAAIAIKQDLIPYGASIETLINTYAESLLSLQPAAPEQAAIELIGLVLISDTELKDIRTVVKRFFDVAFSELEFITRMNIAVDNNLNEALKNE